MQIRQRDEEIEELSQQLEKAQEQCRHLEGEVARHSKYEDFLEWVRDTAEDATEISDLIGRYETLENARGDLLELKANLESKHERARNELDATKKDQAMEMLSATNEVAELQSKLERA